MTSRAPFALALALTAACAGQRPTPRAVADLDRMLASPAAREVAREAPDAYSAAVTAAERARAAADDPARLAEAEQEARIVFEEAQCRARMAVARRRTEAAERAVAEVDADVARMDQETRALDAESAQAAEARQRAARAREAAAAPSRVAAAERAAAAADLRQQARLFVAAAVMLGADEARVTSVRARIDAAERAAAPALGPSGEAYVAAERLVEAARAARPAAPATAPDEAALTGTDGLDARRDARGVIAVLRGLFAGPRLAPTARQRVETLARVVRAQGDARVRVEVFVGGPARAPAEALAGAQAQSLAGELRRLGVPADRLQAQGLHRVEGGSRRDDRVEVVLLLPNPT
ncbi:MAG: hypothetical protein U0324_17850 [Polyangiales bacterium]